MGKAEGVLVDAWYTGFAENDSRAVYFCVLGIGVSGFNLYNVMD